MEIGIFMECSGTRALCNVEGMGLVASVFGGKYMLRCSDYRPEGCYGEI